MHVALVGAVRSRAAARAGAIPLLVITGRGDWGGTERGVLRRMVPRWLNEPAIRMSWRSPRRSRGTGAAAPSMCCSGGGASVGSLQRRHAGPQETMYLSDDTRLTARGNPIVHETLDGEAVIINLHSGTYYSLQGVGAVLWQALVASTTVAALGRRFAEETSLTPEAIGPALERFVAGLYDEALIAVEPPPSGRPVRRRPCPPRRHRQSALALQRFTDVQELLALDPVHDVDEVGWPVKARTTGL